MGPHKGRKHPGKPVMANVAAPMAATKPAKVPATRAGRSVATTKPAAPAVPVGRGPRSRTPRQYEP
jgi:hypothetical protein